MSRVKSSPSYRLHKPTGQAVVTLDGHDHYLGNHGTTKSLERYNALLAQWHQRGGNLPAATAAPQRPITVGELAAAYLAHAREYYRRPDQSPTSETSSTVFALRPLLKLFVHLPAAEFTPLKLIAVRDEMIKAGWVRTNVNRQVNRLRRMFSWGVERELIPNHNLDKVKGLHAGRSAAVESDPIKPVPQPMIDAVLPLVSRQVRAMIEVQLCTGMRPGEVCSMRTADLQTGSQVWIYTPATHKNAYRGHRRTVWIGPRAQEILRPWLRPDLNAYLFSPAEADAERRAALATRRRRPRQPSQVARMAQAQARCRRRAPTGVYTVAAYRQAIQAACDRAFALPADLAAAYDTVTTWENKWAYEHRDRRPKLATLPPEVRAQRDAVEAYRAQHRWHPHQLRHNAATDLRARYGLDAARVILGHRSAAVTEIYAEADQAKALKIVGECG